MIDVQERALRAPGSMELDPNAEGVPTDETSRLIASDKVEGTAVYDRDGEHLGSVHNFMVDKVSGQVAYAVLAFGGFLGLGESHHPLPWRSLPGAPRHGPGEDPFTDPAYGGRLDDYYGGRKAPTA